MKYQNRQKSVQTIKKKNKRDALEEKIQELTTQLAEQDAQLAEIYTSKAWKLAQLFRKISIWLFPQGSWLERIGRALLSIMMEVNFLQNLFLLRKNRKRLVPFKSSPHVKIQVKNLKKQNKILPLKPKIAYVIPGTAISGGVAVICEHTNRLLQRGYDVSIISEDNFGKIAWFPNQQVPILPLNQTADINFDIIVATGWTTAYIVQQLQADRKMYFVQSDESRFYAPKSLKSKWAKKTYAMNFEFITMARWLQDWLKNEFGKNSTYVPNGINEAIIFPDKPIKRKENKTRILLEGPINIPSKGMEDAFMAVNRLDCEVWCVSSFGTPKPSWKCDKFFEKVPFGRMRHIYSSCDILLKMSRVESFAYPPLEMMACGGTAVIGEVTGINEYAIDGFNSLIVEQGDIHGAHKALKKLIENKKLRNKLSANGKKTAKKFRWQPSIDILENIILGRN